MPPVRANVGFVYESINMQIHDESVWPFENVATAQQVAWIDEAWLVWEQIPRRYLQTPNGNPINRTDLRRREDFKARAGDGPWRNGGPAGGALTVDWMVEFVSEPNPKQPHHSFAYTWAPGDPDNPHVGARCWTTWILKDLDDPSRPPPFNTEAFFKETIWHEMGHVVVGILSESWGGGYVQSEIQAIFGGAWNTGQWEQQALEAACETWKQFMFPERQYDNRTYRQLRSDRYERYCELMFSKLLTPPPPLEIFVSSVSPTITGPYGAGDDISDMAVIPKPDFDYGITKQVDYDFPLFLRRVFNTDGNPGIEHVGWYWGGSEDPDYNPPQNTIAIPALGDITDPQPGPRRKPPRPGSRVHFSAKWEAPLSQQPGNPPTTRHGSQHSGFTPETLDSSQQELPVGREPFDTLNGSIHDGGAGNDLSFNGAIVWGIGAQGNEFYNEFIYPDDLKIPVQKVDQFGTLYDAWKPIVIDLSGPGQVDFDLTVPQHDGELCLLFTFLWPAFTTEGGFGSDIFERWPVRQFPGVMRRRGSPQTFSAYPQLKTVPPYKYPQGDLVIGNPRRGVLPESTLVVGSVTSPVELPGD